MKTVAGTLEFISHTLNYLALRIAVLAVVVMVLAAGYQVIARYIFSAPPAWTEELARYAMIWAGLMGASVAFRTHADPTLFPGKRKIQGIQGLWLALARAAGVLTFTLPVLYFCTFGPGQNIMRGFMMRTADRQAELLGISMAYITAAIPLAFFLITVHLLADLAGRIDRLRSKAR